MISMVQVLPAFIATAFLLALVPGQTVAMILRQAIVGGTKTAYTTLIGTSGALIIWGAASAIGLSAIFARSQSAYNALKYAGVAFLTFLALQTLWSLRKEFGKFDYEGMATSGFGPAFRLGLITNLTNVKAAVFAVAFIPAFVPADFNLGWGIFLLSIVQAITSASWYSFLVHIIGRATTILAKPKVRRALTAFSALGILFLAATLLLTSPR
ncbi:MAG: LysE family translocator [Candidatus Planktophila sp.]|jgi:threonine/homoserine/homoserine lactone efflux protein|nr:LysE family translocator [Candidatus Planktophila sp.]